MGAVVPMRPDAAPNSSLSPLAIEDLARSGITPAQAEHAGMLSVDDASTVCSEFKRLPALVIPYFDLAGNLMTYERDGQRRPFCRVRYLVAPKTGGTFTKVKARRYDQPPGSPVLPYFPQVKGLNWRHIAAATSEPCVGVEGEKKALAGALNGLPVFGLGGVWNFLQHGALKDTSNLIPELDALAWRGRDFYLAFDSDAPGNKNILAAEGRLARELGLQRGAKVYCVRFPHSDTGKIGLDDYLLANGADSFLDLARTANPMREADALVAELNQEHAVVCVGGKTLVAHFGNDAALGRQLIRFFARQDFELRLANRFTTNPDTDKPAPLAKVWLAHPQRREYLGGVAFAPLLDVPDDTLNLWRGFSVEPKAGDWSLLRAHMLDNICSGNSTWFEYLMNWLAQMIQSPAEPGQVAIVLRGKKGVGKGKFATWAGRLMREHFFQATQNEHVTGKFNSHLLDTVLLFADEALFAGDPRNEKILNGLITEELRVSEQKFMPAISVANCLHLIMATNSTWAVPATENERRYFVLDVGDAHMQHFKYFAAIDTQMENGGAEAMLYELQQRDVSAFEVRHVPFTPALAEQQTQTLHARGEVTGWIYEVLESGEIQEEQPDALRYPLGDGDTEILKTEARRIFDAWARRRGRRPIDPGQFGRDMRAILRGAISEKRRRKTAQAGQRDERGRPESYVLRSLGECREAYRVAMAMPDLWNETDA